MAPRGFDESEVKMLTKQLMTLGREMFCQYGLKKTNIKELTQQVGIAQGSFYKFFESKEELYFTILEEDEQLIKESFMQLFIGEEKMTAERFSTVLLDVFKLLENYPMIKQMITNPDEIELVVRKVPKEKLEEHFKQDALSFAPLLEEWKKRSWVDSTLSLETVTSVLRSLFLLLTHKNEIGEAVFDDTMRFLIDSVAEKLFKKERGVND